MDVPKIRGEIPRPTAEDNELRSQLLAIPPPPQAHPLLSKVEVAADSLTDLPDLVLTLKSSLDTAIAAMKQNYQLLQELQTRVTELESQSG